MAAKSRSLIIQEVEEHVQKNGGTFREWFVGVTADPKKALFTEHRLKSNGDAWICRRAIDDLQAGEVSSYFVSVRGTKGGKRASSLDEVYVYAYKIKPHTRP